MPDFTSPLLLVLDTLGDPLFEDPVRPIASLELPVKEPDDFVGDGLVDVVDCEGLALVVGDNDPDFLSFSFSFLSFFLLVLWLLFRVSLFLKPFIIVARMSDACR